MQHSPHCQRYALAAPRQRLPYLQPHSLRVHYAGVYVLHCCLEDAVQAAAVCLVPVQQTGDQRGLLKQWSPRVQSRACVGEGVYEGLNEAGMGNQVLWQACQELLSQLAPLLCAQPTSNPAHLNMSRLRGMHATDATSWPACSCECVPSAAAAASPAAEGATYIQCHLPEAVQQQGKHIGLPTCSPGMAPHCCPLTLLLPLLPLARKPHDSGVLQAEDHHHRVVQRSVLQGVPKVESTSEASVYEEQLG